VHKLAANNPANACASSRLRAARTHLESIDFQSPECLVEIDVTMLLGEIFDEMEFLRTTTSANVPHRVFGMDRRGLRARAIPALWRCPLHLKVRYNC
jgi:hypothetical protein